MNVVASTVKAQKFPIREIDVAWASPSSTGGNSISAYKVEWFAKDAITEIQTIETTNADQGTFRISFMGNSTTDLSFDISDVNMRYALMNINGGNGIGHLQVSREGANNGYKWFITFMHSMNAGDVPPLVGDASFLSASNSGSTHLQINEYRTGRRGQGGKSEIQQITVSVPQHFLDSGVQVLLAVVWQLHSMECRRDGLENGIRNVVDSWNCNSKPHWRRIK